MKLEDVPGPIIKWTEPNDQTEANAVLDYIEAAIRAAFNDRAGMFSSTEAYEAYRKRMRQEFTDRLMQLARAK
jgi:hypothetical protein